MRCSIWIVLSSCLSSDGRASYYHAQGSTTSTSRNCSHKSIDTQDSDCALSKANIAAFDPFSCVFVPLSGCCALLWAPIRLAQFQLTSEGHGLWANSADHTGWAFRETLQVYSRHFVMLQDTCSFLCQLSDSLALSKYFRLFYLFLWCHRALYLREARSTPPNPRLLHLAFCTCVCEGLGAVPSLSFPHLWFASTASRIVHSEIAVGPHRLH